MKYPPTSEPGSPLSACQRSGSVNLDTGIGTTSTAAGARSRREANTADQPDGSGAAAAAGNGLGTSGKIARTAQDMTTAVGRHPDASRGRRATAYTARPDTAASKEKARSAAAAPSATMENLSGSTALRTGRPSSQYHGSLIPWYSLPLASRVPPSESTPSTTQATAEVRTGSSRQKWIAASRSTTINGHPR